MSSSKGREPSPTGKVSSFRAVIAFKGRSDLFKEYPRGLSRPRYHVCTQSPLRSPLRSFSKAAYHICGGWRDDS